VSSSFINPRQPIVLEVGGQRLRVNANANESHLAHLADVVNERFSEIQRSTKNNVPSTVLALVSLDLADEVQALQRKLEDAREESKRAIAAAEARVREVEQLARRCITEAIAEIDRTLVQDCEEPQKESPSGIETA
jgi:cell division protein ZapA (FtsZ GTPase activity inhibitor)